MTTAGRPEAVDVAALRATALTAKISRKHRDVLRMLADRTSDRMPEPGTLTSSATFADRYNVWVHWRTARVLHRAGLVTYPYIGSGYDGDVTTVALTAAGHEAATP